MKKLKLFISVLFMLSVLYPATSFAIEMIDHSSSVFKFQQKLADKGNAQAQYKLGYFYETGEGVKADFDKALHWYERAAGAGVKAAGQRHDYLMIKELGFDRKIHSAWLDGVKKDAADHDASAMLLLGQLYHQGIGVSKDLDRSLDLLTEVASLGAADVGKEIAAVRAEISAQQKSSQVAINKPAAKAESKPSSVQKTAVKGSGKKQNDISSKTAAQVAADMKAEKRRRYEEVMAQLKREQQLIDEQQASVTGEEVAVIDDEI